MRIRSFFHFNLWTKIDISNFIFISRQNETFKIIWNNPQINDCGIVIIKVLLFVTCWVQFEVSRLYSVRFRATGGMFITILYVICWLGREQRNAHSSGKPACQQTAQVLRGTGVIFSFAHISFSVLFVCIEFMLVN